MKKLILIFLLGIVGCSSAISTKDKVDAFNDESPRIKCIGRYNNYQGPTVYLIKIDSTEYVCTYQGGIQPLVK